jgi:hypothetical protein
MKTINRAPPVLARSGPMPKLGPNTSTDRTVGSVQAPSATVAGAELATAISTFFARPTTDGQLAVIYNGDRQYAQVVLTLETAGPVAVSTKQQILPVLSGKGQLLETGVPLTFTLAKGNRLWVATTSLNRIKVTVQPLPWLEQIAGLLGFITSGISGLVGRIRGDNK